MHQSGVVEHANRAEVDADRDRTPEESLYLFGSCRGRQVPVEVRMPKQRVPNGAAHAPRLEPGLLEPFRDLSYRSRRAYHRLTILSPGRVNSTVSFVLLQDALPRSSAHPADIFRPCQSTPRS
jgi:hypothetical protein